MKEATSLRCLPIMMKTCQKGLYVYVNNTQEWHFSNLHVTQNIQIFHSPFRHFCALPQHIMFRIVLNWENAFIFETNKAKIWTPFKTIL